jgi:glutamate-1-semialdehyde aminotransferase
MSSTLTRRTQEQSRCLYRRAKELILGGTQTISKQPERYDPERFPAYIDRARGCRIFDIDGNEFLDYVMALGPVILGYCHPAVDQAVREQLARGVLFSGNSPLEVKLAETLIRILPNAERLRFFKTGAEAASAAIRLARNFTGRELVASCGYHGWHDTFVARRREPGIPAAYSALICDLPYGDMDAAERLFAARGPEIACVIIETAVQEIDAAYLGEISVLARRHGALVVFDEIITGFRVALGGVQELTGFRADIAAFGKAMANGFPLSAVAGRRDIFDAAEGLWISSTFGGEALSLAASLAAIHELESPGVFDTMASMGRRLLDGWRSLLEEFPAVQACVRGPAALPLLQFAAGARAQEDAFISQMLELGVVTRRGHPWFLTLSHTPGDIAFTLEACRASFSRASEAA